MKKLKVYQFKIKNELVDVVLVKTNSLQRALGTKKAKELGIKESEGKSLILLSDYFSYNLKSKTCAVEYIEYTKKEEIVYGRFHKYLREDEYFHGFATYRYMIWDTAFKILKKTYAKNYIHYSQIETSTMVLIKKCLDILNTSGNVSKDVDELHHEWNNYINESRIPYARSNIPRFMIVFIMSILLNNRIKGIGHTPITPTPHSKDISDIFKEYVYLFGEEQFLYACICIGSYNFKIEEWEK